jgi:MinD superfamily P-loop ATPase
MKKYKEIVVVSGKGGTGKTTITACLADMLPQKIIADSDVDASNLYLLLKPENIQSNDFKGKSIAQIDPSVCTSCGLCKDLCRFHAIGLKDGTYQVDPFSCDGCRLCEVACPADAVEMIPQVVGKWYRSSTECGDMVHARLEPGAENSGSLVSMVRNQAKKVAEEKGIDTILIDGPPGIGCPVIATISGTDLAIIVTEPTYSGMNDLERIIHLTSHFKIKCGIVVNRCDINPENTNKIEDYAKKKGIQVYAKIPHLDCVMQEISKAQVPSRICKELSKQIQEICKYIDKVR